MMKALSALSLITGLVLSGSALANSAKCPRVASDRADTDQRPQLAWAAAVIRRTCVRDRAGNQTCRREIIR